MIAKNFQILKGLKLQHQLLLLLAASSLLPAAIGLYGTLSFSKTATESALEAVESEIEGQADVVDDFLEGVNEDVLYLSNSAAVQGVIRARATGGTDPNTGLTTDEWLEELGNSFIALLNAKSRYQKFRLMDEDGNELIRIEKDNENRDQIRIIPNSELQNKANRPYFNETMQLPLGETAVSRVNLQVEQKQIIEPNQPVMQYTTPVRDENDQPRGIVVGNIFADEFIDLAEAESEAGSAEGEQLLMVSSDGYYISNPDKSKEWGLDLQNESNLKNDIPPEEAEAILSGDGGVIEDRADGLVYSYAKVNFSPNQEGRHLYLIEQIPYGEVFGSIYAFRRVAFLVVFFAALVTLPLAIFRGRQILSLVQELTNGISSASQQIFSTVSQQERIANQQAASVNETTTTMAELEASSRQSSEQAMAAVQAAKSALDRAEVGTHAIGETLEGMFTVEQKVDAIARQIVDLSNQAGQIGNISQLVSDFANQTNMLALNSSVEAARAGEYGKGFTVVANEIRKLADQSQQSAEKISALVADSQKLINETVMVTEEGTKTVRTSVDSAKNTEGAFLDIKKGIDEVVLNNQQVALTQRQQLDAIQQVLTAMEAIDLGSKESVAGLGQTRTGTQQLSEAALSLRQTL